MQAAMYMMMIEKTKTYNKITKHVIIEHVTHIRESGMNWTTRENWKSALYLKVIREWRECISLKQKTGLKRRKSVKGNLS